MDRQVWAFRSICIKPVGYLVVLEVQLSKNKDRLDSFRTQDDTQCNTSGVLNTKIRHVIICIAHHSCVSENFDMHPLKQVYFYVYMCCLVWNESSLKTLVLN